MPIVSSEFVKNIIINWFNPLKYNLLINWLTEIKILKNMQLLYYIFSIFKLSKIYFNIK